MAAQPGSKISRDESESQAEKPPGLVGTVQTTVTSRTRVEAARASAATPNREDDAGTTPGNGGNANEDGRDSQERHTGNFDRRANRNKS